MRQVAEPKGLLPVMLRVLKGKHANLHKPATQVVFLLGEGAVGELASALKREKAPALRLVCLQTLAMVGPRAKEAVPELIHALEDDAAARLSAARALGNIGPDVKIALAALARAEKDKDDHVPKVARAAMTQINADPKQKVFEFHSVITAADPLDRVKQGHHSVMHTYYIMKAGQKYTINLKAKWDNWMRLEDPRGKEVAFDDDSGGDKNARIVYQAKQDGWRRIVVISWEKGPTWPYMLKVE